MKIFRYNFKIRQQILIFFIIFAIVPSTLITAFTFTSNNSTLIESKSEISSLQLNTLTGISSQYSIIVNNWIYQNSQTINIISKDPLIRDNIGLLSVSSTKSLALEKINNLFSTWVNSNSAIEEMMLLNYTSGDIILSRSTTGHTNTTNNKFLNSYFIGAKATQGTNISSDNVYFKQIYFSNVTNSLMMDFSKVLRSNISNTVNPTEILVTRIDPNSLYNLIAPLESNGNPSSNFYNSIGLGQTGEIYLIDMNGLAISRSRFNLSNSQFILKQDFNGFNPFEKALNQGYFSGTEVNYLGKQVYGVYSYLGTNTISNDLRPSYLIDQLKYNLQWVLVVEIDKSEVLAPVSKIQNQQNASLMYIISIISIIGIAVIIFSFVLSNSLSKPIVKLSKFSQSLADGDLSMDIESSTKDDEIGDLQTSFKTMIDFLKPSIESISNVAKIIASSSEEMASSSEEVNASGEEMSSVSQQISRGAQHQTELLNQSMKKVVEIDKEFSEKIKTIKIASDLIENISNQVNMLALNASIEAARAGDYGRGFSVVADNIRRLADETKNSVDKVNKISSDLKIFITSNMNSLSTSVTNVISVAEETASGAEEASAASEEQAATIEEFSAAAQELAKVSNDLEVIVKKFKLS